MKQLHTTDRAEGYGAVYLRYALERPYPNAQPWSGAGNTCFPPQARLLVPGPPRRAAITWMKACCKSGRWRGPLGWDR